MAAVEGVTGPGQAPDRLDASEPVTGVLADALAACRDSFNRRIGEARRRAAGFDPDRFARQFAASVRPAVEVLARVAPARVVDVTAALFDVSLTLAERGSLGPVAGPLVHDAWARVLPGVPSLLVLAPARVARELTHAVYNLSLVHSARPHDWIAKMATAAPACETFEAWQGAGAVAAWTCGVAQLRATALETVRKLPRAAAMAVLDVPATRTAFDVAAAADALSADPWLPPARAAMSSAGYRLEIAACIGGFRGFGGPFIVPPDVGLSAGQVVVFDGRGVWQLFADACGATLVRVGADALDPAAPQETHGFHLGKGGRVSAGEISRVFPALAEVSTAVSTSRSLVVAVPRSHDVFVVGLVPMSERAPEAC